jgi:hypothetical protein
MGMKKSNMLLMSMMMMAASGNYGTNIQEGKNSIKKTKKKIIPKGCKEYFFFESGNYMNTKPSEGYNIVFECIASSDKIATKKFNKTKTKTL